MQLSPIWPPPEALLPAIDLYSAPSKEEWHEMAEKIVEVESKVNGNELKGVSKAVEAPTKLDALDIINRK
jgi:hypothetical protein